MKAFPNPNNTQEGGMDLEDWFSGLAMQGLLQHVDVRNQISQQFVAEIAYEMAKEMMKERNDRMEEKTSVPKD